MLKKDARYIAIALVLGLAVGEGIAMQYMVSDSQKYGWILTKDDWLFCTAILGPVITLGGLIPILIIAGVIAAIKYRR